MARFARNLSVNPSQVQIVHVWNRCVRKAFLCGFDPSSGRDFEHRREWARDRLQHLASIFAIDCLTYSIMHNHTHQILRSRPDIVATWSDEQVAVRWLKIYPRKDRFGELKEPTPYAINKLLNEPGRIAEIRLRLSDISWWMKCFSQYMATRSNREDEVVGHFWESRFGSELLVDDASVLACMIYVDLNPIRAQAATTPEDSDFTGAKDRIDDVRIGLATGSEGQNVLTLQSSVHSIHDWERAGNGQHSGWMAPIEIMEAGDSFGSDPDPSGRRASRKGAVAMALTRYLQLLDCIGRQMRSGKRGAIPSGLAPVLTRLGVSLKSLLSLHVSFGSPSGNHTGKIPQPGLVHT